MPSGCRTPSGPPKIQTTERFLATEGTFVHPEFEQEGQCLPHLSTRVNIQMFHDLGSIQIGPHGVELFLLAQHGDACHQFIHPSVQGPGL